MFFMHVSFSFLFDVLFELKDFTVGDAVRVMVRVRAPALVLTYG
jgi:hypothetical protein